MTEQTQNLEKRETLKGVDLASLPSVDQKWQKPAEDLYFMNFKAFDRAFMDINIE